MDSQPACPRKHPNPDYPKTGPPQKLGPPPPVVQPEPQLPDGTWRVAAEFVVQIDPSADKKLDQLLYCSMNEIKKIVKDYLSRRRLDCDEVNILTLTRNRIGLGVVRGWNKFVVEQLDRIGLSPTLDLGTSDVWDVEQQRVTNRIQATELRLGDKSFQAYDKTIDVPEKMLVRPAELRFSLGHETGHLVDDELQLIGVVSVQRALLGWQQKPYPLRTLGHHQEYFADAFSTMLLLTAGFQFRDVIATARDLFEGERNPSHPQGDKRIENIRAVITRHIGRAV